MLVHTMGTYKKKNASEIHFQQKQQQL